MRAAAGWTCRCGSWVAGCFRHWRLFQACVQVRGASMTLLVDCGATSLVAMRQQDLDPAEVDAVVVSHLHGDHFGGIPFLILHCQFAGRVRPLTIVGWQVSGSGSSRRWRLRDGPRRRRGPCQWSPTAGASGRPLNARRPRDRPCPCCRFVAADGEHLAISPAIKFDSGRTSSDDG
jgi:hypothetical protein